MKRRSLTVVCVLLVLVLVGVGAVGFLSKGFKNWDTKTWSENNISNNNDKIYQNGFNEGFITGHEEGLISGKNSVPVFSQNITAIGDIVGKEYGASDWTSQLFFDDTNFCYYVSVLSMACLADDFFNYNAEEILCFDVGDAVKITYRLNGKEYSQDVFVQRSGSQLTLTFGYDTPQQFIIGIAAGTDLSFEIGLGFNGVVLLIISQFKIDDFVIEKFDLTRSAIAVGDKFEAVYINLDHRPEYIEGEIYRDSSGYSITGNVTDKFVIVDNEGTTLYDEFRGWLIEPNEIINGHNVYKVAHSAIVECIAYRGEPNDYFSPYDISRWLSLDGSFVA